MTPYFLEFNVCTAVIDRVFFFIHRLVFFFSFSAHFSFAAVIMPQNARPLPFQYQFAAGAVAGVSEVCSLHGCSSLYPTDRM